MCHLTPGPYAIGLAINNSLPGSFGPTDQRQLDLPSPAASNKRVDFPSPSGSSKTMSFPSCTCSTMTYDKNGGLPIAYSRCKVALTVSAGDPNLARLSISYHAGDQSKEIG